MIRTTLLATALTTLPALAMAADPASCAAVRLSDPGWTDITATNGVATVLLSALGYQPEVQILSVPIGYEALKTGNTDAFLGNWMPAQQAFRDDLDASGSVRELAQNLTGAKFTLAVTAPGAALGVADFADLDAQRDAFDGKIYGIEPGAPANQSIQAMIDADEFGLGDWELVESSEQGMLAQVTRNSAADRPSVFLAWAPHPMNIAHDLTYLSGGDAQFGPDFGGATVHTLARGEWADTCPNVARLLSQLEFDVDMENALMARILDNGDSGEQAARAWLAENPDRLTPWLDGITTLDGQPGLDAVKAAL
ncbi:MAG: choline ABC transporter substrate-binding protein [Paracoccus sp. (in: a-proteobacteria)]|uniref:choline ABC transporter substrate-binding protein n=1 Tax=Paracoccus sp. TaxID=267 RepID=UPI0026DEC383|nr:choline ABC transporter substrate-binding protein [Paracoccus sp. (in: a-proteobacteria)]MDO5612666.1 choline ABC transporter substrate-binding protein [Paracoccus sp. (in: a-proteobacteria)]